SANRSESADENLAERPLDQDTPQPTSELSPAVTNATTEPTPEDVERYRQNSLDCNFIGMYKRSLT
ncbi:MAG: hypothetical protein F6K16_33710, partial [Symploca sp. SIO2B6]|nr:hypothetical protein [Symploca sp. SIO2B6]